MYKNKLTHNYVTKKIIRWRHFLFPPMTHNNTQSSKKFQAAPQNYLQILPLPHLLHLIPPLTLSVKKENFAFLGFFLVFKKNFSQLVLWEGGGVWWGWVGLSSKWRKMKIKKILLWILAIPGKLKNKLWRKKLEKNMKNEEKSVFCFFNWIFSLLKISTVFLAEYFYSWISKLFFHIFREKWKFQQIVQIMYNVKI